MICSFKAECWDDVGRLLHLLDILDIRSNVIEDRPDFSKHGRIIELDVGEIRLWSTLFATQPPDEVLLRELLKQIRGGELMYKTFKDVSLKDRKDLIGIVD